MNPVLAFVIVMLVWTVSDWVAKKTKSLLSSLFVASIIFLIGFMTGVFPTDLLPASSLLGLAGVVVGFIIVHLGHDDQPRRLQEAVEDAADRHRHRRRDRRPAAGCRRPSSVAARAT